jgi:prefoldin subunit 5
MTASPVEHPSKDHVESCLRAVAAEHQRLTEQFKALQSQMEAIRSESRRLEEVHAGYRSLLRGLHGADLGQDPSLMLGSIPF